ncbi:uncharacterized protein EI90DRAFT_177268 [Cantharellus anzutake]|uniref:uncharacterized protein n=1 Tax=Cantharellus anzutake TaxID=1750568 RepID=UPI0019081B6E|nr:uncharacterized protein EI90DRAFT_177268 [Cantharellus anzutake]KAF8336452.1 hypothetical protein EI90DRAFT_177268 [Cantharellus anzutake]
MSGWYTVSDSDVTQMRSAPDASSTLCTAFYQRESQPIPIPSHLTVCSAIPSVGTRPMKRKLDESGCGDGTEIQRSRPTHPFNSGKKYNPYNVPEGVLAPHAAPPPVDMTPDTAPAPYASTDFPRYVTEIAHFGSNMSNLDVGRVVPTPYHPTFASMCSGIPPTSSIHTYSFLPDNGIAITGMEYDGFALQGTPLRPSVPLVTRAVGDDSGRGGVDRWRPSVWKTGCTIQQSRRFRLMLEGALPASFIGIIESYAPEWHFGLDRGYGFFMVNPASHSEGPKP